MKILYLCADHGVDLPGVNGASIQVRSFVQALAGLGHEVTVVGTKVSSPESFEAATHTAVVEASLAWWNRSLLGSKKAERSLGRSSTRGRDAVRAFHNLKKPFVAPQLGGQPSPLLIAFRLCGLRIALSFCMMGGLWSKALTTRFGRKIGRYAFLYNLEVLAESESRPLTPRKPLRAANQVHTDVSDPVSPNGTSKVGKWIVRFATRICVPAAERV